MWIYKKKIDNCGKTPTRWIGLCPAVFSFILLSRMKRKKKFYSHYAELAKFHTMHYSHFLLLLVLFSFAHNYNNKPLQPIMHNAIGYPSKYNPAIKIQILPLKLPKEICQQIKPYLQLWVSILVRHKFFLSPTHTPFLASLLVAMLQRLIFLHAYWSLNSAIH